MGSEKLISPLAEDISRRLDKYAFSQDFQNLLFDAIGGDVEYWVVLEKVFSHKVLSQEEVKILYKIFSNKEVVQYLTSAISQEEIKSLLFSFEIPEVGLKRDNDNSSRREERAKKLLTYHLGLCLADMVVKNIIQHYVEVTRKRVWDNLLFWEYDWRKLEVVREWERVVLVKFGNESFLYDKLGKIFLPYFLPIPSYSVLKNGENIVILFLYNSENPDEKVVLSLDTWEIISPWFYDNGILDSGDGKSIIFVEAGPYCLETRSFLDPAVYLEPEGHRFLSWAAVWEQLDRILRKCLLSPEELKALHWEGSGPSDLDDWESLRSHGIEAPLSKKAGDEIRNQGLSGSLKK